MIAAADVFDRLPSSRRAEIDVEVGHGNAVGIEKPLEEKVVAERIDVGDPDRVRDDAPDARTAPRAHGNAVEPRPVDIVPHDEEVIGKAHFDDDAELVFRALHDLVRDGIIAFGKPLHRQLAQILGRRRAVVRRIERNERFIIDGRTVVFEVERRIRLRNFIGNDARIRDRVGQIGKERSHLVARLHIKFVRLHFHAGRIVERALGLNAHEHVLHLPILFFEVVNVVGGNKLNPRFPRKAHKQRQNLLLLGNAVILNFDIEILAERLFHFERKRLCLFVLARHQIARNTPRKARRKADHAVGVLFEYLVIDTRTVIIPVDESKRIELDEIDVARLVFGEQNEVIGVLVDMLAVVVYHVKLAPDDVFDTVLLAFFGKTERSVHIPVVGDRHGIDAVFLAVADEVVHFYSAVQKAVFGMKMKMYKIRHALVSS